MSRGQREPGLDVELRPAATFAGLGAAWCALEAEADRPFFASWLWASALIAAGGAPMRAAVIRERGAPIGACLLWPTVEVRHGAMPVRQLRVNEIWRGHHDFVFSEFTDILARPGREHDALAALIAALCGKDAPPWDELIFTNALASAEPRFAALGLKLHRRAEAASGYVDLDALRARGVVDIEGYARTLGVSTRAQVLRSMKLYAARGALRLERAANAAEAIAWYDEIVRLHTEKWRGRGRRGVGDSPLMNDFNVGFLERALPLGAAELLRVSAGDEPFAWLYNFVDRGKVLFNIGGFRTEEDNRLKPGLVAHALAIEDHLKAGRKIYDFLAGGDRYKTNLGTEGPHFVGVALQRRRVKLQIEDALRGAKRRLTARGAADAA